MDTCIVCLGDLRTVADEPPPNAQATSTQAEASNDRDAKSSKRDGKSLEDDDEAIAHLLPCKHDLHNSCLKPWVERANSCPICRATFNMVELCEHLGGPAVSSYTVQDKAQEAEVDPTMIVEEEDELFAVDTWEPCLVCGTVDETNETMYCDRCDTAAHVFCAGYDQSPEVWYCQNCLTDLDNGASTRRRPRRGVPNAQIRRRVPNAQNRRPRNDALWARIWQEVSRSVDIDLDFPFDDEPAADQRTPEQRREFARWQRRFEVANQQGATERLRNMATERSRPSNHTLEPVDPESQEEIRAWNAFDKARESMDAPLNLRRRKRRATDSPASPAEPEQTDRPPQKRPRLRRPPGQAPPAAESSNAAAQRAGGEEGPAFLSSLLREVECKPMSASSPGSDFQNGQMSPRESSPEMSPMSSGSATPREGSATPPPPHPPLSPPLSASNLPLSSPISATFSPFSPTRASEEQDFSKRLHQRGRQRPDLSSPPGSDTQLPVTRDSSSSPARGLSSAAKEEVQRMVKAALKPHYRTKSINKDEYTDINRDVSRKLYNMVGNASALSDQKQRERFQDAADEAVASAVTMLNEQIFLE